MVMGLVVTMSIVGAGVIQMASSDIRQSSTTAVVYDLEQIARLGLESNYSMLRTLGTATTLVSSSTQVQSSTDTLNRNVTSCSYFPRTDDAKLPTANAGSHQDTGLVSGNSATCLNARANSNNLSPTQLARFSSYSNADAYDTGSQLNTLASGSTDTSYRSIFPWVRYRSESVMNDQYGANESIRSQINQCGLMSQLRAQTSSGDVPIHRFRYQQDLDGLGETWINLGTSTHNIYQNGATLEAWVWMGNATNAARIWQRVFDIGRGQQDGNLVLAYRNNTQKIDFHIKGRNNCTDPTSSNPQKNCSNDFFQLWQSNDSSLVSVPTNNAPGNSLDESSGNDLWYYLGVVIEPNSVAGAKVKVYTQCSRTGGGSITNAECSEGTLVRGAGSNGLYLRAEKAVNWNAAQDYAHLRHAWIGKSHWTDDDFRGKIRDARFWGKALDQADLAMPINVTTTDNSSESSIVAVQSQRESLRISPLYSFGGNRLLLFTVQESGAQFQNTWRLVSCAWSSSGATPARVTKSMRFRVVGDARPEALEILPY